MSEEKVSDSEQQARAKLASIKTMVAALQVDYDRLQELRDELTSAFEDQAEQNDPNDKAALLAWVQDAANSPTHPFQDTAQELADMEAVLLEMYTTAGRECTSEDDARESIEEHALSIEVLGGWTTLDQWGKVEPEDFCILLYTGGPSCRIRGELSGSYPSRAWLEHQDWYTPWTRLPLDEGDEDALLTYARCFCFEMD